MTKFAGMRIPKFAGRSSGSSSGLNAEGPGGAAETTRPEVEQTDEKSPSKPSKKEKARQRKQSLEDKIIRASANIEHAEGVVERHHMLGAYPDEIYDGFKEELNK